MSALPTEGLSTDQAPPLAVPMSFFALAPVAILAAGTLLVFQAAAPFAGPGSPSSLALTHLGTLGLLGSVMLGALYQMTPVVAGARVEGLGIARAVAVGWGGGVALLVAAFLSGRPDGYSAAGAVLGIAGLGFALPVGAALLGTKTRTWTVFGMRVALLGFVGVAALGLSFVALRAGGAEAVVAMPGFALGTWRAGHIGLALTVWVGGLLSAVSWQVLPMFYLSEEPALPLRATITVLLGIGAVGLPAVLLLGYDGGLVGGLVGAGAIAVWLVQPVVSVRALRARQRRRRDDSLLGWWGSLLCAPAVFGLGVAAVLLPSPRWDVAFVWLGVWGWAGLAMHGMLVRIVPFLVWFHRFSPLVGIQPVPPMRRLLPQERIRRAVVAHGVSLALGLVAIGTGWGFAARATGLALIGVGGLLGWNLLTVLRAKAEDA